MPGLIKPGLKPDRDILGHWIWVLPVLLIVAALSLRQIDLYQPTFDEYYSMHNSGWIVDGPYSPVDVLHSLEQFSANHTPFYYLLLNRWGHLFGYGVVMGRVITIFAGILALAMIYRLAHDVVAPVAGLFALCLVASNAFYNYYYSHIRLYPLLLFVSALVIWLYIRIIYAQKPTSRRDYLSLGIASYLLANTHAFSGILFASLAIYHTFFVPWNQRWRRVTYTVIAALILFSPWMAILLTKGIDRTFEYWQAGTATVGEILSAWLAVSFNGSYILPLISVGGLLFGLRARHLWQNRLPLLYIVYPLLFFLIAHLTLSFGVHSMRLALPGWPLTILLLVTGLHCLYCVRRWLGLLVIVWIVAGMSFQHSADWYAYLGGRTLIFPLPPWHAISREVQKRTLPAPLISYRLEDHGLSWGKHTGFPQRVHFFQQYGHHIVYVDAIKTVRELVSQFAFTEPSYRLVYSKKDTSESEATQLADIFATTNYRLCFESQIGQDIKMQEYVWEGLVCEAPKLQRSAHTDLVDLDFYSASVDGLAGKLNLVDRWSAQREFNHGDFSIAYQVIGEGGTNEAQVDLDMVHEGELRHFSIDLSSVLPGRFRLVAILYNKHSGERVDWIDNPGYVPSMLELTEIILPEHE